MAHRDRIQRLEDQIGELNKAGASDRAVICELREERADDKAVICEMKKERAIDRADLLEYRRIIQDQSKLIHDMEAKLRYYENPDSPTSKDSFPTMKERSANKKSKPAGRGRGGQKGRTGKTRRFTNPDTVKRHTACNCPDCNSTQIAQTGKTRTKNTAEVPPPQEYFVVKNIVPEYECQKCGKVFDATNLSDGAYGKSVIKHILYLATKNMPFASIREYMNTMFGLDMTEPTIQNVLDRGADMLKPHAEAIKKAVLGSEVVGMDETGIRTDGKRNWCWMAQSENGIHVVIAESRGKKILKKIFGTCKSILVVDGYRPYASVFPDNPRQRCMAHIIRRIRNLYMRGVEGAEEAHHKLQDILHRAMEFEGATEQERGKAVDGFIAEVRALACWCRGFGGEMEKFGDMLDTASEHMFIFVMHPRVPPTNNATERAIRKVVLWRNVHGQLRSKKGMRRLGVFLTCFGTWKQLGLDPMKQLDRLIG